MEEKKTLTRNKKQSAGIKQCENATTTTTNAMARSELYIFSKTEHMK